MLKYGFIPSEEVMRIALYKNSYLLKDILKHKITPPLSIQKMALEDNPYLLEDFFKFKIFSHKSLIDVCTPVPTL